MISFDALINIILSNVDIFRFFFVDIQRVPHTPVLCEGSQYQASLYQLNMNCESTFALFVAFCPGKQYIHFKFFDNVVRDY